MPATVPAKDTFLCCNTPVPWPTKEQDRTCPECGTVWEREPIDLGAGARIKGEARAQASTRAGPIIGYEIAGKLHSPADVTIIRQDQTGIGASSGPGVVPSLVAVAIHLVEDAFFLRMNGERPPGAPPDLHAETWADWDRRAEDFLRREVL